MATLTRMAAAASGAAAGVAIGLDVGNGEWLALTAGVVMAGLLVGVTRLIAPASHRRVLAYVVVFAFLVRLATATVLHAASLALGHGGPITGDDRAYLEVSWAIAQYLSGSPAASCEPPTWCSGGYLLGPFVYLETAVFLAVGKQLLLMQTINAAIGTALVIVVWDLGRRIFDTRSAYASAAAVAIHPGLVLFSALNIKDPLAAALTGTTLLLLLANHSNWRWWRLALAVVLLQPLHGLRQYVFVALAMVIPIGAAMTVGPRMARWNRAAVATVACTSLIAANLLASDSVFLTDKPLEALEYIRAGMSRGRTGFVVTPAPTATPSPIPTTFATSVPASIATTIPTSRPATRATTVPVVGGTPRPTSVPTTEPTTAPIVRMTSIPTVLPTTAPAPVPGDYLVLARTLEHLPRGALHALFAPFPWVAQRAVDVVVIPDTLLWYALLMCAGWTLWRLRRRWRLYLPTLLFVGGCLALFALFEGNVGTLYRHRTITVVPLVAALAGPGLVALVERLATLGAKGRRGMGGATNPG